LPHVDRWEEDGAFPDSLFREAGEAGHLGPMYPEALGGGGGDLLHQVVLAEELLKAGSGGLSAGLGSLSIALPPVLALGTSEQKARMVPPILRGERIAALGISEPGAGSDVAGIRTRAVRDADGYVLDGSKTFITSGCRAHVVLVLARTSEHPHKGLTFFAVDTSAAGFSVSRALVKHGWWCSDTAELFLDGVRVPTADRIGPEGSGFPALMRNFESERLMLAVHGVVLAQLALEEATRYASERQAFGRPIAGHQVVAHKLADMATQVASARALTYAVARRMNAGENLPAEVAMAKNHAGDVARAVCWEAVQILGGMGYIRESRVERLMRDARLLHIGGGTREIMNEIIARQVLANAGSPG
ncbi:MAG: acyl-CoA dehydrogenase family protein, partial [Myxococcales bacterium]|nr:acyl-CoA dehydrogenase family protein [Myxococcales bacterium]